MHEAAGNPARPREVLERAAFDQRQAPGHCPERSGYVITQEQVLIGDLIDNPRFLNSSVSSPNLLKFRSWRLSTFISKRLSIDYKVYRLILYSEKQPAMTRTPYR